jgi:hypothetical protein
MVFRVDNGLVTVEHMMKFWLRKAQLDFSSEALSQFLVAEQLAKCVIKAKMACWWSTGAVGWTDISFLCTSNNTRKLHMTPTVDEGFAQNTRF